MIKSFAISTVTAAFITAASAQPQTAEPHKMDAVFANTATIMVAQAEQDVCPEDKKVGELTKEQREACLGAAAPQPDPFVVRLHGGVNEVSAREIIEDLLEFSKEDPDREIVFYINSLGGYVDQATAIYDTMMAIPNDIRTICEGRAMSAGHMLLTAGTPECAKRGRTVQSWGIKLAAALAAISKIPAYEMNIPKKQTMPLSESLPATAAGTAMSCAIS